MDDHKLSPFGLLLRQYRLAGGWTQQELAERAGLSVQAVSTLERGTRRAPRLTTLRELAEALTLSEGERADLFAAAHGDRAGALGHARISSSSSGHEIVPLYPLSTDEPMVGRDQEVHTILRWLPGPDSEPGRKDLSAGDMRLVLVGAEAGMGKTRLLAELAKRARRDGVLALAGGCYEQEGRLPYGPIHDCLLDLIRAQPTKVLHDRFGDLLPDLSRLIPGLRLPPRERPGEAGDLQSQRLRLFSTVAQTLERIAAQRSVLLLLDDLQWADDGTLQLLHFLCRQPQLRHLLVVGAYREEEVSEYLALLRIAEQQAHDVRLKPLAESELTVVLEERLGRRCAPRLAEMLYHRSGGNPFFALQMAQLLHEEGRLERSEEGWEILGGDIEVPPAVRETVARRLRFLGPDEREALTLGAVLGREFSYVPLQAMWPGNERALYEALDRAVEMHLLTETEAGFAFRHPLVWEVVYGRAPAPRRALLHERVALTLERLYGQGVEEHAAELAHHFVAAGRAHLDRAVRYLLLASDHASRAFAFAETEQYRQRAWDLAKQLGDPQIEAEALDKLASVLLCNGRYTRALEILEEAIPQVEASGDLVRTTSLHHAIARTRMSRGALLRSREDFGHMLRLAEKAGDPVLLALAVSGSGLVLYYLGDWTSARVSLEQVVEMTLGVHPYVAAFAYVDLARLSLAEGRWEQAGHRLRECLQQANALENPNPGLYAEWLLAKLDLEQGRPHAALTRLESIRDDARIMWENSTEVLPILAEVYLAVGEASRAEEVAVRSVHEARALDHQLALVDALQVQAMVLAHQECWEEAEQVLAEVTTRARSMQYPHAEARALHEWGRMLIRKGEPESARAQLEDALAIFRRLGARSHVERTERLLGALIAAD